MGAPVRSAALIALSFALLPACGRGAHVPVVAGRLSTAAAVPPDARAIWAAKTARPVVALTFDDGPDPRWTPPILRTLAAEHVGATFFVLGSHLRLYGTLVRRERTSGQQIACHGWDHRVELGWTRARVLRAFRSCASIVQQTAGVRPAFVRPPYGLLRPDQVAALEHAGFTVVDWSLSVSPGVADSALLAAQIARIRSGTIVLLHDGRGDRSRVVRVLPRLIEGLRARGIRMVTLDELFARTTGRSLEPASVGCGRVRSYVRNGFIPRTVLADLACATRRRVGAA